jgi:predicted dehydrogenase
VLLASQIEVGEMNGLRIRAYGEKGGLVWKQEVPNMLALHTLDGRTEIVHAGGQQLGPDAVARTRTPTGHPEGYLEAFANIYRDFAAILRGETAPLLPGIDDALRGMTFIDTAVAASRDRAGWVPLTV